MAIATERRPYELLVRFGPGGKWAAHYIEVEEVWDGDVVQVSRTSEPKPIVDVEGVAGVVGQILPELVGERDAAAAMAAERASEIEALTAALEEKSAALTQREANLEAQAEQVRTLQAQLDALRNPPAPARPTLPKSAVMARVFGLGKQPEVEALFEANFELQSKWFSPDWPSVYADDPGLLNSLAAIGCTDAEIALITAA
ncbi:hypothetical protein ACO2Q0_03015 [Phenylobacterium sp. VNQ135]|uniref:hypothetical protein n=1 Tax=Phenylobacterium sp. VNQ135 TaxID=3400922 RepID=UPI003C0C1CA6